MLFTVLSAIDIIAGAAIYSTSIKAVLASSTLIIAFIVFFKGIWTFFTTIATGYLSHLWAAALDVAAGVALILITKDIMSSSHILGGIVIAKGSWYLLRSILKF